MGLVPSFASTTKNRHKLPKKFSYVDKLSFLENSRAAALLISFRSKTAKVVVLVVGGVFLMQIFGNERNFSISVPSHHKPPPPPPPPGVAPGCLLRGGKMPR